MHRTNFEKELDKLSVAERLQIQALMIRYNYTEQSLRRAAAQFYSEAEFLDEVLDRVFVTDRSPACKMALLLWKASVVDSPSSLAGDSNFSPLEASSSDVTTMTEVRPFHYGRQMSFEEYEQYFCRGQLLQEAARRALQHEGVEEEKDMEGRHEEGGGWERKA